MERHFPLRAPSLFGGRQGKVSLKALGKRVAADQAVMYATKYYKSRQSTDAFLQGPNRSCTVSRLPGCHGGPRQAAYTREIQRSVQAPYHHQLAGVAGSTGALQYPMVFNPRPNIDVSLSTSASCPSLIVCHSNLHAVSSGHSTYLLLIPSKYSPYSWLFEDTNYAIPEKTWRKIAETSSKKRSTRTKRNFILSALALIIAIVMGFLCLVDFTLKTLRSFTFR